MIPAISGLSIWYTTPAFLYALKAPWDRWTLACWTGILLFILILFPGITLFLPRQAGMVR